METGGKCSPNSDGRHRSKVTEGTGQMPAFPFVAVKSEVELDRKF